jgi:predicted nucleotidyltransferase
MSSPSSFPVGTIDEIRERCKPIFCHPDCHDVRWAGVFGSFSRSQQNPGSDVDLLIGIKEGASQHDFWYLPASVKEKLEEAMQRDVDMHYLEDGDPLSFVQATALVTGHTVYDKDTEWLLAQQVRAKGILLDAYSRYQEARRLARQLSEMLIMTQREV